MFLNIFNWMLAHAPGFIRPALGWLIDGLRSITNYVSQRWTSLGQVAAAWLARVVYWWHKTTDFALTFTTFCVWLVLVFVPDWVAARVNGAVRYLTTLVAQAIALARAGLDALTRWTLARVDELLNLLSLLKAWAKHQVEQLIGKLALLLRALAHVLSGPDVLAQWLAGAMWRALGRLVFSQRERIVMWLTRESVAFTRWLALEVETILLRWL